MTTDDLNTLSLMRRFETYPELAHIMYVMTASGSIETKADMLNQMKKFEKAREIRGCQPAVSANGYVKSMVIMVTDPR